MGRSVVRGGKGKGDRQRAERVVVAAGNYLQKGRSIGASGAINYLRYVRTHYVSVDDMKVKKKCFEDRTVSY